MPLAQGEAGTGDNQAVSWTALFPAAALALLATSWPGRASCDAEVCKPPLALCASLTVAASRHVFQTRWERFSREWTRFQGTAAEHAACATQDPAEVLTDARMRVGKVWADIDEDIYRREAALPFRMPGLRCGRCGAATRDKQTNSCQAVWQAPVSRWQQAL